MMVSSKNDGETIDAGQPILTLFAAGDTVSCVRDRLRQRAERVMERFIEPPERGDD